MKTKLLLMFIILCQTTLSMAQTQKGQDIDGEAAFDLSGHSVSMPDANTVAIGAPYNSGNGMEAGHVRIYSWNGSAWVQKGTDIDGEFPGDFSGSTVSMPDLNTVAIGARWNTGDGSDENEEFGHLRVYAWDGSDWVQKGTDIDGENARDGLSYSISMPDANTVAISSVQVYGTPEGPGYVRIFEWNGSDWVQKGINIIGEAFGDRFGESVSMPDANTVAIGARDNKGNGIKAGHVRVYAWNGSTWVQRGTDIDGEATGDRSGESVSMPDVNTVAIGAPFNNGNGDEAGHVRVYSWNGSDWEQKGMDIDGEAAGDRSGHSVSMPNANTLAIGAPYNFNDGNTDETGHVRVYVWNGSAWVQTGTDIDGEADGDGSGWSVSMPDANTVAIGALGNDENGNDAGQVRVYFFELVIGIDVSSSLSGISIYPNPTTKFVTIELGELKDVSVKVFNINGQLLYNKTDINTATHQFQLNQPTGVYFIEVSSNGETQQYKLVKE